VRSANPKHAPSARFPLCLAAAQVKGLQFNPFSPALLASGAADGELCIWDLASPAAPSLYPALKGGSTAAGGAGEVTFLAWNCKVQHILASTSAGGTTVVWDLKRQRPVISFTDPNGARRCSALAWNPEVATQLITASDDDRSTTLQVWDLRNSISPAQEFSGHSKGVLAMSWCAADTSLLLTCGKDNRTLCWDAPAGKVVAELPASSNWCATRAARCLLPRSPRRLAPARNFDVQWSPCMPGLLSASSFDGRVGVYNLVEASAPLDGLSGVVPSGGPAPMQRAPAWMRRPCGAAFGFGGRLVTFGARREDGSVAGPGQVDVRHVAVDQGADAAAVLATRASLDDSEFQAAVGSGDREALKAYCGAKAAAEEGHNASEAETWAFLRVLLDGENARRLLLRHLDYEDTPAEQEPARDPDANASVAETCADQVAEPQAPVAVPEDDGVDFFENLASTPRPNDELSAAKVDAVPAAEPAAPAARRVSHDSDGPDTPRAEPLDEADGAIQRALVVGNYPAAVAACMQAGRMGDALVLASVGGTDLWLRTQAEYMRRSKRQYMKLVAAVVKNDLTKLVSQRPLSEWRETLAMLCTYASTEEWAAMAAVLATRLERAGSVEAAVLCHICAGDIDAAVRHWAAGVQFTGGPASLETLRRVVEKSIVLAHASGGRVSSAALSGVVNTYAELLASQGHLELAMRYLSLVPGDDSADTAVLRDRIYGSTVAAAPAAPAQTSYGQQQAPQHAAQRASHMQQPAAYVPAPAGPPPPQSMQQQRPPQQQQAYMPQAPQSYAPPPQQSYAPPPQQSYAPPPQQSYAPPPQQTYAPPPQQQQAYAPPQQQSYAPPPAASYAPPPQQQLAYAAAPAAQAAYAPPTQGAYAQQQQQQQQPPPSRPGFSPSPPANGPPAGGPHLFSPAPPAAPPASAPPPRFQPAAASPPAGGPPQRAFQPGAPPPGPPVEHAPPAPPPPPPPSNNPPADATVETVAVTDVAPEARPVVKSLTALYSACSAAASGNAAKKRELDDSSKRLGGLLWKLNRKDVSPSVVAKLAQLCAAVDKADYATASNVHVQLTSNDWTECSAWLPALKRLLKTRQLLH
jgi:protein transport protein SEC31